MKKDYEVWSEGYAATGQYSPALYHGHIESESFDEACIKLIGIDGLDKNTDGSFRRGDSGNFTIWGCNLYDNEKDAKKHWG